MLGAICGDVIGSVYEGAEPQAKTFPLFDPHVRFTDDTVLTVAVASAVREGLPYADAIRAWGRRYPHAGYGGYFRRWMREDDAPAYGSFGNGSAMRVSAIGWAGADLEVVIEEARRSAIVTHDHAEGIRGAQAIAAAVYVARCGRGKGEVAAILGERFGYDCVTPLATYWERGEFDVTCQGTVPAAAAAFLESEDWEDAVRNAVSLGGDADTLACIAGAMAEAHYGGVPAAIQAVALARLDAPLLAEALACARAFGVPVHAPPGDRDG